MKEKDLKVEFKEQEIVLYAEKEDHSFEAIVTGSRTSRDHLDDFYAKRTNLEHDLRTDIEKGKISPVYFYMLMQDIGQGDLAKRIGISKRKLRKHFTPDGFAKLDDEILQKYALVFGVTVEGMKAVSSR